MLLYIWTLDSICSMTLLLQYQRLKHTSSSTDLEIEYNIIEYIIEVFQNYW